MNAPRVNESKAITIYDIAKEAGVSPSTVSRVLTNNANVRPEKKERVQMIIDKYNFKPNALARGLAEQGDWTVGGGCSKPILCSTLCGLRNGCKRGGL